MPKTDKEKVRKISFTVRLTENQYLLLKKAAGTCGKSPVTFVREKLFKGRFPSAQLPRIEMNTYLELKKIGLNLSQLMRLANAGKIDIGLVKILLQLMRQQERIIGQILYHDSYPEDR